MLQHNNNNNHLCLDSAHRELLHGCKRGGATFSGALGFSAVPLIKGLRAWAVSGGYSRSRRKAVSSCQATELAHEGRVGCNHGKDRNVVSPCRIRQGGGSGALVTVATLKDSDRGRQTQTRCLFLRSDGCNYMCTLGTSGRGSQGAMTAGEVKPQARKWRKPGRPKPAETVPVVGLQERQKHGDDAQVCFGPTNSSRGDKEGATPMTSPENKDISTNDEATETVEVMGDVTAGDSPTSVSAPVPISLFETTKSETDDLEDIKVHQSNKLGMPKCKNLSLGTLPALQNANKRNVGLLAISRRYSEPSHSVKYETDILDVASDGNWDESYKYARSKSEERSLGLTRTSENVLSRSLSTRAEAEPRAEFRRDERARSFHHEEKIRQEFTRSQTAKNISRTACSSSQGSGSSQAAVDTNPVNTDQEEEEEEEGVELRGLALTPDSEPPGGLEEGKVADERTEVVDEDEEDEFGVFMKAGEEQIWNTELQRAHCKAQEEFNANQPSCWTSDWPGVLSIHQSDGTWTAFKQEVDGGTEKEVWFSKAEEKEQLECSSLNNLPGVFVETFPCMSSSTADWGRVSTLKELLRGSTLNNRNNKNETQSLLDGLQDLDHMIGVKYKGAESLSHKLLLQSLNLSAVKSDRAAACGRKPNSTRSSSNQQLAANRRLSYGVNRNVMP